MKVEKSVKIAIALWNHFNAKQWDQARELLDDDFEAHWPQSREFIKGPDNFIRLNREYPGTHKIQNTNHLYHLDQWEFVDHVVTEAFIETISPDGKVQSLYAISFFEIQDEKIMRAREYWADTYQAPDWRKHLVERY